MKKTLYVGLTTTTLAVLGILSSSRATTTTPAIESGSAPSSPVVATKVGERQSTAPTTTRAIASLHRHQQQGREAVTVYLRGIPVLTFLGQRVAATEGVKVAAANGAAMPEQTTLSEAAQQATILTARLNQLHEQGFDANLVRVGWDAQQQNYRIYADKEPLLTLNNQVTLPNSSQRNDENALRITNLIRRQLGNAPALTSVEGSPNTVVAMGPIRMQLTGIASWYGPGFHGARTANGERFDQDALTAAHRTLPFGTRVRVTNLQNGRSVVVRINDRGPFTGGREIDLSRGAAAAIGLIGAGVGPVRIDVLD
ncbi:MULTISPECIES: septal ring lytic transglycosylase RlpA family protein [unclassified Thermosynechococcus]|uniref:septal ring lytic transglycosylase RlpA family protein n=1 Tax=unclassified Thermosynechococcus TaxID=2622553 RepID=UPI0026732F59|nr:MULTISPECIES: septal ring lytic transglycosylase RlpA family protein [unclassified Thermosynechococcus]WKT83810.1 septal ring lytic transglycosylase RlpA family protein [Thermosynechococcus sp. HY596]WNC62941.1 septal ring lytic transglycosylase RlpA family protein [Thermosynechococcus sp. HY591]WNC65499.1 septal ring lytic transglycosylase RlpA family protein [Thermosynechococcus sp. HY593]